MPGLNPKGIAWPLQFGPLGHLNRVEGKERIKQNLVGIAMTQKGERIREKSFGTIGYSLIMRNVSAERGGMISFLASLAFSEWEPRARVREVQFRLVQVGNESQVHLIVPYTFAPGSLTDVAEATIGG